MWLSILKFFLEIISLGLALALNFILCHYRFQFHKLGFETFEKNLNQINGSLFSAQYFDYDYKKLKNEESLYAYLMVTIPTVAIFIRTCYSEFGIPSTGIFILIVQLLLIGGAIYFAKYKHQHYLKLFHELKNIKELNEPLELLATKILSPIEVINAVRKLSLDNFNENDRYYLMEKLSLKYLGKKSLF